MEYIEYLSWVAIGISFGLWLMAFFPAIIDHLIITSNYNSKYYRFNNALNRLQETKTESEKLTWYALFMFYAEHSHKVQNDEEMVLFADGYFTRLEEEIENRKAFLNQQ